MSITDPTGHTVADPSATSAYDPPEPAAPVQNAIEEYERAIRDQSNANSRVHRALDALEQVVIDSLGDNSYVPCSESDPIQVVCGDRLVTLKACDCRPAVEIEPIYFVD